MLLQLQKYTFTLVYKPGKEIVLPDTLSCAYLDDKPHSDDLSEDLFYSVNQVISNLPVSDAKLEVIRQATASDPAMLKLHTLLNVGGLQTDPKFLMSLSPIGLFKRNWVMRMEL